MMGLPLPNFLTFSGNLVCELFMTIFNIHFFTQVQTKVDGAYLGRVLSTIFTLAILFMPVAKGLMTFLPSVQLVSFLIIGLGVVLLSLVSMIYIQRQKKDSSEKNQNWRWNWINLLIKKRIVSTLLKSWYYAFFNFKDFLTIFYDLLNLSR